MIKPDEVTELKVDPEEEPKSESNDDNGVSNDVDNDVSNNADADADVDFNDVKVVNVFEEEEEDVLEIATTKQEIDFESESKDDENKEAGYMTFYNIKSLLIASTVKQIRSIA